MQCHNTDVILAARFSNKLVLPCSQLGKYAEYTRRYPEAHGSCRSWHGNMILWSRIFPIFHSAAQIQIAAGVQLRFMLGKPCSCAPAPQVQQWVAEL